MSAVPGMVRAGHRVVSGSLDKRVHTKYNDRGMAEWHPHGLRR